MYDTYLLTYLLTYFLSKMSPQDGSRQKLRNYIYICKSHGEKTVASFFRTRCMSNWVWIGSIWSRCSQKKIT